MSDVNDGTWTTDIPTVVGDYWFYGDDLHGEMGIDFRPDKPPTEPKMVRVEVVEIRNGIMAKAEGHFVPLRKFDIDGRAAGVLGYWKPFTLPEPPPDFEKLFVAGPDFKAV